MLRSTAEVSRQVRRCALLDSIVLTAWRDQTLVGLMPIDSQRYNIASVLLLYTTESRSL